MPIGSDRPRAVGPYSPSVRVGEWLICSGQVGLRDGALVEGGVAAELEVAIERLVALLAEHGANLEDVVKTTIFLTDIDQYATMNEAYVAAFGDARPARSAVAVSALPLGASVEIEAWAHLGAP